jgi:hypothetical protein
MVFEDLRGLLAELSLLVVLTDHADAGIISYCLITETLFNV